MGRIMRNIKNYVQENKKRVIISAAGAIVVLVGAISIFAFANHTFFSKDTKEAAVETKNTDEKNIEDVNEGEEKVAIAAEVGEMDDAEDPQENLITEDGSSVNMVVTNDFETSGVTYGIDVSKYQGKVDWAEVASAGVEYAMIRVGYRTQVTGVIYEDPTAKYNMQEAQKNGIKIGVYFFSTAVNETEVIEEAAWTSDFIARYKITYPVVYNCEGFQSPDSRQYSLSKEERTVLADKFLSYIQNKGYIGMFYASKSELEGNAFWNTDDLSSKYKIWVSWYSATPFKETDVSSYTGTHAMWQYTNKGTVSGIDTTVDLNVAYFGYSKEAEAKDSTPAEVVEADPEVGINFTEVNETVTAKMTTNLRTVPNSTETDTIAFKLKNGETVSRTGIGNNGWSRVVYNGQTLYAVSSYLTTDLSYVSPVIGNSENGTDSTGNIVYEDVNEQVTAKDVTNLRSKPGSDFQDTVVATLHNGEIATRTGIGNNGWSRIEFNGQVLYARTDFLTTDLSAPAQSQTTDSETSNGTEMKTKFASVSDKVTAKEITNLRTLPGAETNDTVVAQLTSGEVVARTGVSDNGWSRVEYNGQTLYAVTSYLTVVE